MVNNIIISLNNISFDYKNNNVIKNINLNIKKGEFISIIGPNGAGKSTLLKIITGILTPQKGEIKIKQQPIKKINKLQLAKEISYLPQNIYYFDTLTVKEIVYLGRIPYLKNKFFPDTTDQKEVEKAIEITGIKHLTNRYINKLSGGEKQLTFIAKLISQKTDIMILDEPTTFLDIKHTIKIMNIIKQLNLQNNITIIASMHDLNIAAMYSHKIALMKKGEIISFDHPHKVLTYQKIKAAFETEFYIDINDLTAEPIVLPLSPKAKINNGRHADT